MRVSEFIISRNITFSILNLICEYLFLPSVRINVKVSDDSVQLWDLTLNDTLFEEWYRYKIKIDKIETNNAKMLIKELRKTAKYDDFLSPELCQRILNSYLFLIKKSYFSEEEEKKIIKIINLDEPLYKRITLLKKHELSKIPLKEKASFYRQENDYYSSYDPYENFHWGGLSGEEAFDGYWNTQ